MYSSTTCRHGHGPELHGGDCRSEWEAIARTVGLQPKQIHRRRRGPWLWCGCHIIAGGGPTTWGIRGCSMLKLWSAPASPGHGVRSGLRGEALSENRRQCMLSRGEQWKAHHISAKHTSRWGSELRGCNDNPAIDDCRGRYLRFMHNFVVAYVPPINTSLPRRLCFMELHLELHTILSWLLL
jgi:hypothetical protein